MENAVQKSEAQNQLTFNEEQVQLIKKTVAKDATDNEFGMFLYQAQRTGLDPLARQIYLVARGSGTNRTVTIQTSIDGLRVVAERSNKYEGQTKPEWCGADGIWKDAWLSTNPPVAARIGVYKKGFREALYGVAKLNSYKPDSAFMWNKMPEVMLSKCAEALALRKAFPQDLSGIYTNEEMEQADMGSVQSEKKPTQAAKQVSKVPEDLKNILEGDVTHEDLEMAFEGEIEEHETFDAPPAADDKITDAQIRMLGRFNAIEKVKKLFKLESLRDLSKANATKAIDYLLKEEEAQKLNRTTPISF